MTQAALRPKPDLTLQLRPAPVVCLSRGVVAWSECQRELDMMRRRYLDASEQLRSYRSARRGRA